MAPTSFLLSGHVQCPLGLIAYKQKSHNFLLWAKQERRAKKPSGEKPDSLAIFVTPLNQRPTSVIIEMFYLKLASTYHAN